MLLESMKDVLLTASSSNISNIYDQYQEGKVGSAFACADNSGTVQ